QLCQYVRKRIYHAASSFLGSQRTCPSLEHDPEKWVPVFGKACPRARPEGSCSNNKLERDGDSKKRHLALGRLVLGHTGRHANSTTRERVAVVSASKTRPARSRAASGSNRPR